MHGAGAPKVNLVRSGAIQGLLAWIAYWLIESFFLHVLPWLKAPSYQYMPSHAGFTAVLLGIYSIAGLLTGAAAGVLVALWSARRPQDSDLLKMTAVLVSVVLCFRVSRSVFRELPPELPRWYAELVFLPIGLSFLVSLFSPVWLKRLAFLTSPWTAVTFLLAPPFLLDGSEGSVPLSHATISLLLCAGVAILISFLIPLWSPRRRTMIPVALLSALMLAVCFPLHRTPRLSPPRSSAVLSADTPNVILITLDTVRADHLSLYGYARNTTPNLNRLAHDAVVYTNAVSTGNMTLSSHASMFTGLYPSWHQAHLEGDHAQPLDPKCRTLAEILSSKGFDTVGIVSNYFFLSYGFGLDRGFAYHDSAPRVPMLGGTREYLMRDAIRKFFAEYGNLARLMETFRKAEEINGAAFAALDREASRGKKFFLFLNYMDAHWPYLPPEDFATLYPGRDSRVRYSTAETEVLRRQQPLPDWEREALISQYDGSIAYLDWSLGKLFDQLKQRGLYDNTLLIIAADHGEAFGDKAILGHGLDVYQDEIHVPLIIKYPHSARKAVVSDPVSLVDLMPTTLDALGYEIPRGIQGGSLLRQTPGAVRDLISEGFTSSSSTAFNKRFQGTQHAIFSGPVKFIEWSTGKRELYDISRDPNELHNLLPAETESGFEWKLTEFLKAAAQRQQQGSKTSQNLRSLGYLQ